ncbi:MAG: hypothetical protein QGG54_11650 [Gammaproteobacteria bacterium]|jgi:hypothetical protein|nr:hypothetical protein [Gammaproteobacteria bacterium]MDP6536565.1 hypothetical protein [Gammaproteobacteria bacterium]MDP6733055.1 hypothetical protein [Gammaproteobacteria bacterium]HAJ76700.1 hypothetical protein [Gammaproteobacteria bacterium]|tara:strand:+ start:455 stop:1009 length:555 start_codon:yes stop_codon:yes gene_type:complete
MNWEAIGAIGELLSAFAVLITLLFLAVQVRHSNHTMAESNRLERVAVIDRHADSVSRWRGLLMENPDLAQLWMKAREDKELDDSEKFLLDNIFIDFNNIQRSNFVRANAVGEQDLGKQAVRSVLVELVQSETLMNMWEVMRPWNELGSPEFVAQVQHGLSDSEKSMLERFGSGSMLEQYARSRT